MLPGCTFSFDVLYFFALNFGHGLAFTGYQEKFYFNPGDTGFKVTHLAYIYPLTVSFVLYVLSLELNFIFGIQVFETKFAKIGVGKLNVYL